MGATLREFPDGPVTVAHFHALLNSYTMAQFLDQDLAFPWTGEYYNGENAQWRTGQRDYNHSTYIDLVIAEMAGLRPRPDDVLEVHPLVTAETPGFVLDGVRYHNHDITLAWHAPGGRAVTPDGLMGFRVYVDGKLVHHDEDVPSPCALPDFGVG